MPDTCQICGSQDLADYVAAQDGHFRRCRACGLIFNAWSEASIQRGQDEYNKAWPHEHAERRLDHKVWSARARLELIQAYRPDGRLLDVGCGGCAALVAARELGYEAVGIDAGDYPVQLGAEMGLDVRKATLTATGFPDASFDVVTLWNVLEHIPRTKEGLAEVCRVLKPGGVVALIVPSGEYLKAQLFHRRVRYYRGPGAVFHYTYHNPRTIRRVLAEAGFELLSPHRTRFGAARRGSLAAAWGTALVPSRYAFNLLRDALHMRRDLFVIARKPARK